MTAGIISKMTKKEGNISEVESVLFSSGRWMSLEELVPITGYPEKEVKKALNDLKKRYEDNVQSSLILIEEEGQWKLTVKQKYVDLVSKVISQTELPKSVMETLAVIAFKYPILQSDVIKIRTSKAYDHLHELEDLGYIARERFGRTKKIKLTQKFFDYFDIPEEKVRDVFARFDAVEKSIEKQEKENDERQKEMDQKTTDAQDQIEKEKEMIGPLEIYDEVADKVGVNPEKVADEALEVDIPRAKASKLDRRKLDQALTELNQIDDTEAGDDAEEVPDSEDTDEGAGDSSEEDVDTESDEDENPDEDLDEETEEKTDEKSEDDPKDNLLEEEQGEDGDNIDPFFDTEEEKEEEPAVKIVDEEKGEPEEDLETSETEKQPPTAEEKPKGKDIFSNPDLNDDSLSDRDEESNKRLDNIYDDVEKSKDELTGKMNKNFNPR